MTDILEAYDRAGRMAMEHGLDRARSVASFFEGIALREHNFKERRYWQAVMKCLSPSKLDDRA